jgi:hypothetical protein
VIFENFVFTDTIYSIKICFINEGYELPFCYYSEYKLPKILLEKAVLTECKKYLETKSNFLNFELTHEFNILQYINKIITYNK